ncbi:MAG: hypothetical protein Q8P90_04305 [bacterium]|nr:hypothetical protein [bacterium]
MRHETIPFYSVSFVSLLRLVIGGLVFLTGIIVVGLVWLAPDEQASNQETRKSNELEFDTVYNPDSFVIPSDEVLREQLSELQYHVT